MQAKLLVRSGLDLNLIKIMLPGRFGWLLTALCYSCAAFLFAIGTADNHSAQWLWIFLGPPALFVLIAANSVRYALLECQLQLRTPMHRRELINAFAHVAALMLLPAWGLALGMQGTADALWVGLIWSLFSIGLALMQTYLIGVIPLFILLFVLRYGLKVLGFEHHFWDLIFALTSWTWLALACASCVAGWLIDRNRTQALLAQYGGETAHSMAELSDVATDFDAPQAGKQPELSESEYLESIALTSAEYFDELDNAALCQPGVAVMAMLMGEPLKVAKKWALGLSLTALIFIAILAAIGALGKIHSIGTMALALTALALSANAVVSMQRLTTGISENLPIALAPAVLRDRELRGYLVRRVINDAFALLLTALPLLVVSVVLLTLPLPKPLFNAATAGSVLLGFAAFAALYPGLVALIYMRYRPGEALLWFMAMLTAAALAVVLLMLLGRLSVTPIWLSFLLCALVVCVDSIRYQPIRLVHFLEPEELRPSRF